MAFTKRRAGGALKLRHKMENLWTTFDVQTLTYCFSCERMMESDKKLEDVKKKNGKKFT